VHKSSSSSGGIVVYATKDSSLKGNHCLIVLYVSTLSYCCISSPCHHIYDEDGDDNSDGDHKVTEDNHSDYSSVILSH